MHGSAALLQKALGAVSSWMHIVSTCERETQSVAHSVSTATRELECGKDSRLPESPGSGLAAGAEPILSRSRWPSQR